LVSCRLDELDFPIQVTDGAAVTYTNPDVDFDDESSESIFDRIKNAAKDFTIGAGYSVDNNMFFGVTTHVAGMNDNNLSNSISCKVGRVAGDLASIIGSGGKIASGTGGEVGGVILDATGGGAIVGIPVNVGSAVLVSDGVVNGYRSTTSLADDLMNFAKRDQEGGRPEKGKEFRGG